MRLAVSGCDSAQRPCTKNVARAPPRPPRTSRMCSALPGGTPRPVRMFRVERQAQPAGVVVSLTSRDLRCADVRAGRTARSRPRAPRQELRGNDGDRGCERRSMCADVDPRDALGGLAVFDDDEIAAAPAPPARRASPTSRSRVSGSVAMTMAARSGSGQLERPVAELRRLERLDRQPDGLLQCERAHLGRGPRGTAPQDHRVRSRRRATP